MKNKLSPTLVGALGMISMMLFYFVLLYAITQDILHPWIFFLEKWYWFSPLFVGFGIQLFLFQKLRIIVHTNNLKMAGATAGTNGVAMAACCAHHLAEIFPILGLAGASTIVTKYQDLFLAFGVIVTLIGIIYMKLQINKHKKMECCISK